MCYSRGLVYKCDDSRVHTGGSDPIRINIKWISFHDVDSKILFRCR